MSFKFISSDLPNLGLYNPGEHSYSNLLTEAIFAGLYNNISNEYIVTIESGFYNPTQMATELTNKFNETVTKYLDVFFADKPIIAALFKGYDRFNIVYNSVEQKLWFGNNADQFVLTNSSFILLKRDFIDQKCIAGRRTELPNFVDFGLPAFLGFTRCNSIAQSTTEVDPLSVNIASYNIGTTTIYVPRFYYGDVNIVGDNGFWLLPELPGATVFYLEAPLKINFMGPAYIYMEIDGLNCIDETIPYNISTFTTHTNQTNGVVNSAFAKIPVSTTPISQWFDSDMTPYKYFNPPAERIRKLKIKLRYHNNVLVDFGSFDYSFMLEFCMLKPQGERKFNIRDAYDLSQTQGV